MAYWAGDSLVLAFERFPSLESSVGLHARDSRRLMTIGSRGSSSSLATVQSGQAAGASSRKVGPTHISVFSDLPLLVSWGVAEPELVAFGEDQRQRPTCAAKLRVLLAAGHYLVEAIPNVDSR